MLKKALTKAILAEGYIALIILFFQVLEKNLSDTPDTIFAPIAMLSLFVLSASIMGYLFLLEPLQLYFDGSRKEATQLFLNTVGIFAVITVIVFVINFVISI